MQALKIGLDNETARRHGEKGKSSDDEAIDKPTEGTKTEIRIMPVKEQCFTQASIRSNFTFGRTFENIIQQFIRREVDPLHDLDWLTLMGTCTGNRILINDNRRLYALDRFQQQTNSQMRVRVNLTVFTDENEIRTMERLTLKTSMILNHL